MQFHPLAHLLVPDENTPRHLAHALVDLGGVVDFPKNGEHIKKYRKSLLGVNVDLDESLENRYISHGVNYLLLTLHWTKLETPNPASLYVNERNAEAEFLQRMRNVPRK